MPEKEFMAKVRRLNELKEERNLIGCIVARAAIAHLEKDYCDARINQVGHWLERFKVAEKEYLDLFNEIYSDDEGDWTAQ